MPVAKYFSGWAVWLLLWLPALAGAQDIQIQMEAEVDSVQIGVPFRVRVSVTHPADLPVIFPDTSSYTTPYEIYAIEPEDAVSQDSVSVDARTYLLQSFEIDPVQYISIPVAMVLGKDTIWVTPEPDSVIFKGMISDMPPNPAPWRHSGYFNVDDKIDAFELTVFIVALASALTLLGFALRKPVLRMLYRWRCKREHQQFQRELDRISVSALTPAEYLHEAGLLVRKYLETRVHAFLPSFTTPEFSSWLERNPAIAAEDQVFLHKIHQQGDLALYAGILPAGLEKGQFVNRIRNILQAELDYRLTHLPI